MKNIIRIAVYFCMSSILYGEYKPLLIFYERSPWLSVIGADSPAFALYEDGTAIFWRQEGKHQGEYKISKLSAVEISEKFDKLLEKVSKLDEYYSLTLVTDQITNDFVIFRKDNRKKISVYGNINVKNPDAKKVPGEITKLLQLIIDTTKTQAATWQPNFVEVMIWPYEYAPEKSVEWPKNWPDLKSKYALQRGESYSIYLPFSQKADLIKLLNSRKEKGAILINDKKWAIDIRIPFPHESGVIKMTP